MHWSINQRSNNEVTTEGVDLLCLTSSEGHIEDTILLGYSLSTVRESVKQTTDKVPEELLDAVNLVPLCCDNGASPLPRLSWVL